MKKILAFGASSSRRSINQQLATWAANQLAGTDITILDLNDFEMPVFSVDKEREGGIPEAAKRFRQLIAEHDAIVVSFAEHNGAYSAAFKNLMDWASRLEGKLWAEKQMFCLATSPGGRGGASALQIATGRIPFMGGHVVAQFSLPRFKENFSPEQGIVDADMRQQFEEQLALFAAAI